MILGFHPVFNRTFEYDVLCPDLAIVEFQVMDYESITSNQLVAQSCMPFNSLQQGRVLGVWKFNLTNNSLYYHGMCGILFIVHIFSGQTFALVHTYHVTNCSFVSDLCIYHAFGTLCVSKTVVHLFSFLFIVLREHSSCNGLIEYIFGMLLWGFNEFWYAFYWEFQIQYIHVYTFVNY